MRRQNEYVRLMRFLAGMWLVIGVAFGAMAAGTAGAAPILTQYIDKVTPAEIVPGADHFGPVDARGLAPALKGDKQVGWVFLTSDFVSTTGYSGKPIHIVAGISDKAVLTGVKLVKHSEPIVLVGIPEAKIKRGDPEICRARSAYGGQGGATPRSRHRLRRDRHHHGDRRFHPARRDQGGAGRSGSAGFDRRPRPPGPTREIDRDAGAGDRLADAGRQRRAAPPDARCRRRSTPLSRRSAIRAPPSTAEPGRRDDAYHRRLGRAGQRAGDRPQPAGRREYRQPAEDG